MSQITSRSVFVLVTIKSFMVNAKGQRKLVLIGGNDEYELIPYLGVFEDKECQRTIQEIILSEISYHFNPTSNKMLNPSITISAWWVRVELVDFTKNGKW